jgi:hypothetical protein
MKPLGGTEAWRPYRPWPDDALVQGSVIRYLYRIDQQGAPISGRKHPAGGSDLRADAWNRDATRDTKGASRVAPTP